MKTYRYSFAKTFEEFWFIFLMPAVVIGVFSTVNYRGLDLFLVAFTQLILWTIMIVPLVALIVLLKTTILIDDKEIVQKNFMRETRIRWLDVFSVERKNFYVPFPDPEKPEDIEIADKNKAVIRIYRFLKDYDCAEIDIRTYSKKGL